MIFTVTLNPAIDKTAKIDGFAVDQVNKIKEIRLDAGGKGINASKVIHNLGGKTTALGFVGGANGDYIATALKKIGIEEKLIRIDGETRCNLKVVDIKNNTFTDINEPGPVVSKHNLEVFEYALFTGVKEGDIVLFAGGLPQGVNNDYYGDLTKKLVKQGVYVAADLDGDRLKNVIEQKPWLIKPNDVELQELLNLENIKIETLANAAKQICAEGIENVIVSLGARGALFVNKEACIHVSGPKVNAISTVGAGDTITASYIYAIEKGSNQIEAATLAVASATAKVTMEGTQPPLLSDIEQFMKLIEVKNI